MQQSPPFKKKYATTLAALLPQCLNDVLAKQGFASSEILTHWGDIAGAELAPYSEPVKMQWPPKGQAADPASPRQPAVLHVRVEGAFALEFQIQAPVILERINRYLGWQCVQQIRLKQGPVQKHERNAAPKEIRLDAETEQRMTESVANIENDRLRQAVLQLGRTIQAKKQR